MSNYRVISSDNHVIEPLDLWTSRTESKFKDRVPHLERLEEGDWWICDGLKIEGVGLGTQAEVRFDEPGYLPWPPTTVRRPLYGPPAIDNLVIKGSIAVVERGVSAEGMTPDMNRTTAGHPLLCSRGVSEPAKKLATQS